MGFSNVRWRSRPLRSAAEGAEGDGDRAGDGPQPVLVEDQRPLNPRGAVVADREAVPESPHPDLVVVGAHGPRELRGEHEVAPHEEVRCRAAGDARVDVRKLDPRIPHHAVAEGALVDGLDVAAGLEGAEVDVDAAVRAGAHVEHESAHGTLLVPVVDHGHVEHRDATRVADDRRGDGERAAVSDQVREAGADHEVVLRRSREAVGVVGDLVAPHGLARVGPTEIVAHEHPLLALDAHAERVEAEGQVVVPVLADGDVGRDGQSSRGARGHRERVDEHHIARLGAGAGVQVHRAHQGLAGVPVPNLEVAEVPRPHHADHVPADADARPAERAVEAADLDRPARRGDVDRPRREVVRVRERLGALGAAAGHEDAALRAHAGVRGARVGDDGARADAVALAVGGAGLAPDRALTRARADRGLAGDAGRRRVRRLRTGSGRTAAGRAEREHQTEERDLLHLCTCELECPSGTAVI